jgi:glycosyltransferase involved in cell wall biosynthesis
MKRVLFITYYFPPSGGSGVQRGLKMVKYLGAEGWEPLVLTVDPAHAAYPDLDPAMATDVPAGTRVERTRAWDPYALYARFMGKQKKDAVGVGFLGADHASAKERFARWIRANLFLPDARVGWASHATRAARALFEDPGFDAIVTTGPPHSTHLIGARLARTTGRPWVADLRDAWPDPAYAEMLPSSGWARRRDRRMRQRALDAASVCLAVTEDLACQMRAATGHDFRVIRNGFDPADFSEQPPPDMDRFRITHTGNLGPARDPEPLWTVLSRSANRDRWPALRVQLVGNVDPGIEETIRKAGLVDRMERIPYVPHHEATRSMQRAALLLLPINRVGDAAGIVTGKIYEYLASGRPIVGLGDRDGEAARILADSGAGVMLDWRDADGLESLIDRHYTAWQAGTPLAGATREDLSPYSRRQQAAALARILDELS